MTYQEILQEQLDRRVRMNPQYSLRAFAQFLGMSPSKLSEVLNLKKGLSLSKALDIGHRLNLSQSHIELFQLSVRAQHSRSKKDRASALAELQKILQEQKEKKSSQRNAWYFGAVKALLDAGLKDDTSLAQILGLTTLQVENSKRFLKRIKKFHPEVTDINFETESVLKKTQQMYLAREDHINLETDFLLMTQAELKQLVKAVKKLTKERRETTLLSPRQLYLINFSTIQLTEGDELC